ncbi:14762_t:CDS:1 [Dentiscutata heterogama]|uniref:14762_t:CDS:1 n=1 Tax=Dentiscutata heterogama TaxID=1316150 RepID=A0ACA9NMF7_9GLOM|nr:14762_t:CDS:1 [Dentiscutata heterogama]
MDDNNIIRFKDLLDDMDKEDYNYIYSGLYQIIETKLIKSDRFSDFSEKKYYLYLLQIKKISEKKSGRLTYEEREEIDELVEKYEENNKIRHCRKANNNLRNIYLNLSHISETIKNKERDIFKKVNKRWSQIIEESKYQELKIPESLRDDIPYKTLDRETFLKLANY